MSLFPMFLKLTARPCLVVGAGTVAESKIESLLAAEAEVRVIAPEALPRVGESPALAQRLRREIESQLPLDTGEWLMELGRLRREVVNAEPPGEPRRLLLHALAQREVCGLDACPARLKARKHAARATPAVAP